MKKDQVEKILYDFLDTHQFLKIGVYYDILNTPTDIENLQLKNSNNVIGLYRHSEQNVYFFSDNIKDKTILQTAIKHEILGHVVFNHLTFQQKFDITQTILSGCQIVDSELKNKYDTINAISNYKLKSVNKKAEEIFAFVAQNIKIDLNHEFTPFEPKLDGSTKEKIENIIQNLAAGIRENKLSLQIENIIQKSQDKGMSR